MVNKFSFAVKSQDVYFLNMLMFSIYIKFGESFQLFILLTESLTYELRIDAYFGTS